MMISKKDQCQRKRIDHNIDIHPSKVNVKKDRDQKRSTFHFSKLEKEVPEEDQDQFCFKMYRDWKGRDIPFDIPVLIIDDKLFENKDLATIPRLNAKYQYKRIHIPFIYEENSGKYETLNHYFFKYLGKDVPSFTDFKMLLAKKELLETNMHFFESINLFLYTSFLLRQFTCAMKIIPYFYTPIQDEVKYYFYICVDYLRQISLVQNKPIMRSTIIQIIEKLYSMEKKILHKELLQTHFTFMDTSFFEKNPNIIIQNEPFVFTK
jgi:hypothetical protein